MTDAEGDHPVCVNCEAPIRNLEEARVAGEVPPDEYDRDDPGAVRYRCGEC